MIKSPFRLVCALVLCQLVVHSAAAQDCVDYGVYARALGRLGYSGGSKSIAIAGHHAYVAREEGVVIVLDVSTPAAPVIVGTVNTWGTDVAIANGHLFVLGSAGGLRIYDISEPAVPVLVSGIDFAGYRDDLAVAGNIAYVLNRPSASDQPCVLSVIDATVPAQPIILETFELPGRGLIVEVCDGWVYYLDGRQNLHVFEHPSPTALIWRHVVPIGLQGRCLHIEGGFALVGGSQLVVVDLNHDDGVPTVVGRVGFPGYLATAYGIDLEGSIAFVAASQAGFTLVDLADPADPQIVAFTGELTSGGKVIVRDGLAFLVGGGIIVLDVSGPLAPPVLGSIPELVASTELIVADGLAYVAARAHGLVIARATDSGELQLIGSCGASNDVRKVAHAGNLVAMTIYPNAGLKLVDVSNPAQPVLVGSLAIYYDIYDVALTTTYAYVIQGGEGPGYSWSELLIVDVTDPTAPTLVDDLILPQRTVAVTVADGLLYAGGYYPQLHTYTLADPVAPKFVATVPTPWISASIVVRDGLLLTCGPSIGVLSLADPLAPQLLSTVSMPWDVQNVDMRGGTVYAAALRGGLQVIDLLDPVHPVLIGQANGPWGARAIGLLGDLVLVTGNTGLLAYPLQCPATVGIEQVETVEPVRDVVAGLTVRPNPFNPRTTVAFDLPRPGHASVAVFDLRGRLIRSLVDGVEAAGTHEVVWDGCDARGQAVAAGTYLLRLESEAAVRSTKILLVR